MIFRHIYSLFEDVDGRILRVYRVYAERWEKRGHNSYGLPLFLDYHIPGTTFKLDIVDKTINTLGFLITTKEPENNLIYDITKYRNQYRESSLSRIEYTERAMSRFYITLTTPFRFITKRLFLYDLPLISTSVEENILEAEPIFKGLQKINRHLRLPMLVTGVGFLAKGTYEVGYAVMNQEPIDYNQTGLDFNLALGFLRTASSAYFKDGKDPKLGKSQKSLQQILKEMSEAIAEKITIKVPKPVLGRTIILEEIISSNKL